MAQAKTQDDTTETVETIIDAGVWKAITKPINSIGTGEAIFEFSPDGFRTAVKDGANVALCEQTIAAEHFEHYDVSGGFRMGVDTEKLEDLIKVADTGDVFRFDWDFDAWSFAIEFEDVYTELSGITTDSVHGRVEEMPGLKDELPYDVEVTLPVDKWRKATKVIDLNSRGDGFGTFRMGGDDDLFVIEGKDDTDKTTVTVHDDDLFEWREPSPDHVYEMVQANSYMPDLVKLVDEDAVRFVAGDETPYHVWTTREDVIETRLMQAPRLVNE